MAIKNALLGGADNVAGEVISPTDVNDTNDAIIGVGSNSNPTMVPLGAIISWAKTFDSHDSGTTTSTTANKLVETGQNFLTTVTVGDLVHNTTDDTFAYVTEVDSDTTLSLDTDIMTTTEAYTIYATPALPGGWAECDGSTISDADSPFNGATLPNLNSGTYRMLRGSISSGTTGGADTHNHRWNTRIDNNGYTIATAGLSTNGADAGAGYNSAGTAQNWGDSGGQLSNSSGNYTANESSLPAYYEVVMIMRIK